MLERNAVAYPNISASGTNPLIAITLPRCSCPSIRPRRVDKSPITLPTYSSGTVISTKVIGSNNTGRHLSLEALNAIPAATSKAIWLESTSWYEPNVNLALTSIVGYPAKLPLSKAFLKPFSTAGIYSRGITPPTISSTNSNPGKGFEFVDEIVGGVIPREFIPSVNKGIENALDNGNLAGYPTIDIKARLVFGSYHDVDSSSTAFEIAGSLAFKETAKVCNPVLLEPIMLVEVVTPDEYLGTVIGDISTRRGRIDGQEARGKSQSIRSFVPLSEMFGYATALRSNTQGRGNFTMQFDHYDECPRNVAEAVMKARSK